MSQVEAIADAVLYEGYLLYPYRRSAVKNQVRWTFGGVHPREWSLATGGTEPWLQQTQCLVRAGDGSADAFPRGCRLDVTVRFLRLLECSRPGEPDWQEATEYSRSAQDLDLESLLQRPVELAIELAAGEPSSEAGQSDGVRRRFESLNAEVEIAAEEAAPGTVRVTVQVRNLTELPGAADLDRERAMLHSMASTHAVLRVRGGEFVSLTDPPAPLTEAAGACQNVGVWPVLVGEPGSRDTLLASPIILEDHPQVAAESPTELFDGTEIDEILTLRILTLSDDEKRELREGDERGRRLLERTEALTADELMRLHGTLRNVRPLAGDRPDAGEVRGL